MAAPSGTALACRRNDGRDPMLGMRAIALLALASAVGCAPVRTGASVPVAATSPQAVVDDLLAADRGYSAAAANSSAADAVAAMLDDDVVLFIVPQPSLVRGKAQAVELLAKAFAGD